MADSPILAARCLVEWQQQVQQIATTSGRKESEVVREASAQYLGKTDPAGVKGASASRRAIQGYLDHKKYLAYRPLH